MIFIWENNRNNFGTELTDISLFWTHIFLGTLVFSTLITGWLQRTALREEITPEFSKRAKKLTKIFLISVFAIVIVTIIIIIVLLLNNPPT